MRLSVVMLSVTWVLCFSTELFAQKKGKSTIEEQEKETILNPYQINEKVYKLALRYNDMVVAREAVYNMYAINPNRTNLLDTLVFLYYNSTDYVQVVLLGNDILVKNPDNATILEIVAVSQQNLGLTKEALENFERLFTITQNLYHQYNIASLQYMLKRYGECGATLNNILGAKSESALISITDAKKGTQKVPIKAAAFNMRGVIALDLKQTEVAKQNFQKALELFPDFLLAKSNIEKVSISTEK